MIVAIPERTTTAGRGTFGNDYDREWIGERTSHFDMERVHVMDPSIAISGIAFYIGDRFPVWKGNASVDAMFEAHTRGTGHIQRIIFNEERARSSPDAQRAASRIRDLRQGPDACFTH